MNCELFSTCDIIMKLITIPLIIIISTKMGRYLAKRNKKQIKEQK